MSSVSWSVDEDELSRTADRDSADGSALSHRIESLPPADPWHVTHGHDLIELLRIGLMHVLGDLQASTGTRDIVRVLRVAIPDQETPSDRFRQANPRLGESKPTLRGVRGLTNPNSAGNIALGLRWATK